MHSIGDKVIMELIHKHINLYLNCKLYTYDFDNTEPTELCNIVS